MRGLPGLACLGIARSPTGWTPTTACRSLGKGSSSVRWQEAHFGDADRVGSSKLGEFLAGTLPGGFSRRVRIADGDRTVNRVEYLLGLAPLDGSSCFVASLEGGTLAWPGAEGVSFAVERSTDMFQWSVIATRVGTAGRNAFVDPAPPAGRAFYRVRLVP